MDANGLITEQEFDKYLRNWAARVQISAVFNLLRKTHSTGALASNVRDFVDRMRNGIGRHIAFRFPQYGVFRAYGAGRGWVIVNGVPVRGYRVLSAREIREHKLNTTAHAMLKKGWRMADIRKAKVADVSVSNPRRPLDWIDGEVKKRQNELADEAVAFFGDKALASILRELEKAKIVKKAKL